MLGPPWRPAPSPSRSRRCPSTCAWPGSPPPTPPAGPGSTTRRSTTSASRSASSAAWCRSIPGRPSRWPSRSGDGIARSVDGEARTGRAEITPNELSAGDRRRGGRRALARHRRRHHALPRGQARSQRGPTRPTQVRTRRRRLSGDWSLRRPGREGPARSRCPVRRAAINHRPGKISRGPPLQSIDAAQAAAPAALRRHRRRSARPRRGFMVLTLRERDDAQTAGAGALGRGRAGRPALDGVRRPGDRRAGLRAQRGEASFLEPYADGSAARRDAGAAARGLRSTPRHCGTQLERVTGAVRAVAPAGGRSRRSRSRRAGDPGGGRRWSRTGTGKALFDRVRAAAQAHARRRSRPRRRRAEQRLDDVRTRLTERSSPRSWRSRWSARSLAGWLIRRWVTRPIDAARRRGPPGARRRARLADPDRRAARAGVARPRRRRDARVGSASSCVESERSRQAVEQSAAVVLTLRSELEPVVGDIPDGWTVAGSPAGGRRRRRR